MTHDEIIENYVSKLGISIEEAEQLLKDEEEDNLPDLTAEQKKIVKSISKSDRKKETTPRVRERKIDADKTDLITVLQTSVAGTAKYTPHSIKTINSSREFEFIYNNRKFKVTLTATRERKENSK
jgi:hypothetical protein